jgi:gamma-glutamyltranspeptidase
MRLEAAREAVGDEAGRLDLEAPLADAMSSALAAKGHAVEARPFLSINTAGVLTVERREPDGLLRGGADPRRAARVMGW